LKNDSRNKNWAPAPNEGKNLTGWSAAHAPKSLGRNEPERKSREKANRELGQRRTHIEQQMLAGTIRERCCGERNRSNQLARWPEQK
jgi:hypothetical protein